MKKKKETSKKIIKILKITIAIFSFQYSAPQKIFVYKKDNITKINIL